MVLLLPALLTPVTLPAAASAFAPEFRVLHGESIRVIPSPRPLPAWESPMRMVSFIVVRRWNTRSTPATKSRRALWQVTTGAML